MTPARIVLVGFMGSGKSSVGSLLAGRFGYRFVDLDREVEQLAGRTIPEIFRERGEPAFRDLERQATVGVQDLLPVVIATGGGWMSRPELRSMWPDAVYVWLSTGPETVFERVGRSPELRPMLDPVAPERSIRDLLAQREPDYALAGAVVRTDGLTVEGVADRVAELVGAMGTERIDTAPTDRKPS